MKDKHMGILVLYVHDLIITRNNEAHIKQVEEEHKVWFKMIDLGTLHYYLGVEVSQHPNQIFLSPTNYPTDLLKKFGMEYCKLFLTPMEKKLKISKFEGGNL
jgi:hypothetical protein